MKVKLLTTAQASKLHVRFDNWFEIQPMPVKNGDWFVSIDSLTALKEMIIDVIQDKPNVKEKAIAYMDAVKDLDTYDTDFFQNQLYNTSIDPENATIEEQEELEEYTSRFSDLIFENVT
jgi:hypothetical protein